NYTYSKSIDDMGSFRTNDNARLDRSLSVADQPQNLVGTAVYQLPFGKGKAIGADNRLVSAVGGGWSLSGIFTVHSGVPVTMGGSGCAGSPLSTCMPSLIGGQAFRMNSYGKTASGQTVTASSSDPNYYAKAGTQLYLNGGAFSVNQPGTQAQVA